MTTTHTGHGEMHRISAPKVRLPRGITSRGRCLCLRSGPSYESVLVVGEDCPGFNGLGFRVQGSGFRV